jgi:hypothetical protein
MFQAGLIFAVVHNRLRRLCSLYTNSTIIGRRHAKFLTSIYMSPAFAALAFSACGSRWPPSSAVA